METMQARAKDTANPRDNSRMGSEHSGFLGREASGRTIARLNERLFFVRTLREAPATSLGKLGAREPLPGLRRMAADESADLEYRKAAVEAIAELKDAESAISP